VHRTLPAGSSLMNGAILEINKPWSLHYKVRGSRLDLNLLPTNPRTKTSEGDWRTGR
jgi:hypothetical protein